MYGMTENPRGPHNLFRRSLTLDRDPDHAVGEHREKSVNYHKCPLVT